MAGSTYGKIFKIATFGESHGPALGVVIDGCPANLKLSEWDIQEYLNRRKPGQSTYATQRKEADNLHILSGVFEGYTTGTPITCIIENENHKSKDYNHIKDVFRPGHADFGFQMKYGHRDHTGGGRSSGRETIGRVCAGAIAKKILNSMNIHIQAYTKSIGPISISETDYQMNEIFSNPFYMPSNKSAEDAKEYIQKIMQEHDSAGGMIECTVTSLPAGIGEPVFDKLDANIGKALFSIGGVKGVEFGVGMASSILTGSIHNDSFTAENGRITKETNHAGGILGGMSDGSPLIVRAAFKPTPSIGKNQKTVNKNAENVDISIQGRHDPLIVPRAVVVVEAMVAISILDLLFENMSASLPNIQKFYQED